MVGVVLGTFSSGGRVYVIVASSCVSAAEHEKKNELSQQYRRVRQVAKAYHGVQRTELMSSFSAQWSKLPDIKTTSALY